MIAQIQSLAQEFPYAMGATIKFKKKKKEKENNIIGGTTVVQQVKGPASCVAAAVA